MLILIVRLNNEYMLSLFIHSIFIGDGVKPEPIVYKFIHATITDMFELRAPETPM